MSAERLLLDPEVRADRLRVLGLMHPEFVEFGASGRIWDAGSMAEALAADPGPVAQGVTDLIPTSLSADAVLLTYRIDAREQRSLRSSVWLRDANSEWLLRFHQGTRTS